MHLEDVAPVLMVRSGLRETLVARSWTGWSVSSVLRALSQTREAHSVFPATTGLWRMVTRARLSTSRPGATASSRPASVFLTILTIRPAAELGPAAAAARPFSEFRKLRFKPILNSSRGFLLFRFADFCSLKKNKNIVQVCF